MHKKDVRFLLVGVAVFSLIFLILFCVWHTNSVDPTDQVVLEQITPNLWIGNAYAPMFLAAHPQIISDLSAIVNVGYYSDSTYCKSHPNVACLHIPFSNDISENTDLSVLCSQLFQVLHFIDQQVQRGAVLIHCDEGKNRSVAITMSYLLYKHPEWSMEQAWNDLRKKAPQAHPHWSLRDNFLKCLKEARS